MSINVGLRITGIYFGSPKSANGVIMVSVPEAPTVKQVLDAAVSLVNASGVPGTSLFTYTPVDPTPMDDVHSFTVVYTEPPIKPNPKTPEAIQQPAGMYVLNDKLDSPYEQSLQYYHCRHIQVNGNPALIQLNIQGDFRSFTQQPEEPIVDGDIIIWRMVTIENAPIPSKRAYATAARNAGVLEGALM